MSYNPINDYKEVGGSDRPERRDPCIKCKQKITLMSPANGACWACYAGWPTITKPAYDIHLNPHYKVTLDRLQREKEHRARRKANIPMAA